jgi:hypothetical protein
MSNLLDNDEDENIKYYTIGITEDEDTKIFIYKALDVNFYVFDWFLISEHYLFKSVIDEIERNYYMPGMEGAKQAEEEFNRIIVKYK